MRKNFLQEREAVLPIKMVPGVKVVEERVREQEAKEASRVEVKKVEAARGKEQAIRKEQEITAAPEPMPEQIKVLVPVRAEPVPVIQIVRVPVIQDQEKVLADLKPVRIREPTQDQVAEADQVVEQALAGEQEPVAVLALVPEREQGPEPEQAQEQARAMEQKEELEVVELKNPGSKAPSSEVLSWV